jgi:hypothetical protein
MRNHLDMVVDYSLCLIVKSVRSDTRVLLVVTSPVWKYQMASRAIPFIARYVNHPCLASYMLRCNTHLFQTIGAITT